MERPNCRTMCAFVCAEQEIINEHVREKARPDAVLAEEPNAPRYDIGAAAFSARGKDVSAEQLSDMARVQAMEHAQALTEHIAEHEATQRALMEGCVGALRMRVKDERGTYTVSICRSPLSQPGSATEPAIVTRDYDD